MAIPNKATGYGNNSVARNVFRLTFSQALSQAPTYEAYDSDQAFPAIAALLTVAKKIFVGTAGNSNKPMLSLVDTSSAAPTSAWKPAAATGGSANPNRMKGTTNYVTATATPGAGGVITWNMVAELPSDLVPSTDNVEMQHDLLIRYTFTGATPALTWAYNEGTEGAPTWVNMTPGTHGIRHAKSGAGAPSYFATVPVAGTQDTAEGWVTT
jgi:hypothetical protein